MLKLLVLTILGGLVEITSISWSSSSEMTITDESGIFPGPI